jgi:hypothetical protein
MCSVITGYFRSDMQSASPDEDTAAMDDTSRPLGRNVRTPTNSAAWTSIGGVARAPLP